MSDRKRVFSKVPPLVSIVIPCYNAERWVAEAIGSALRQTYSPIEVVVVDDGSTDKSLEVIKSFGEKIRWETGPNQGGNAARNRGVALSNGKYIQFLDADDYLLPQKITRQVEAFESGKADVVYEDWQRLQEKPDGSSFLHPVEISGPQPDVLEALLGNWAPPPCALLFKKQAVEQVGGWLVGLTSAQDWELNIRLAMAGATYVYLPGCNSVYRRPVTPTVSTSNSTRMHKNIIRVLKYAERELEAAGRLSVEYRRALAQSYFQVARWNYFKSDRVRFNELVKEARRLSDSFADRQPRSYRLMSALFGIGMAERISAFKRHVTPRR